MPKVSLLLAALLLLLSNSCTERKSKSSLSIQLKDPAQKTFPLLGQSMNPIRLNSVPSSTGDFECIGFLMGYLNLPANGPRCEFSDAASSVSNGDALTIKHTWGFVSHSPGAEYNIEITGVPNAQVLNQDVVARALVVGLNSISGSGQCMSMNTAFDLDAMGFDWPYILADQNFIMTPDGEGTNVPMSMAFDPLLTQRISDCDSSVYDHTGELEHGYICTGAEALYNEVGNGEASDPYILCTGEQLFHLSQSPAGFDKHFRLGADIDLAAAITDNGEFLIGFCDAVCDGSSDTPFTGFFDGDSHTVSGFARSIVTGQATGFFGYLSGATVQDLHLEVTIGVTTVDSVGGLAGVVHGTTNIHSVAVSGSVNQDLSADSFVGGVVGLAHGVITMTDVSNSSNVQGGEHVGALVGKIETGSVVSITHGSNSGAVSSNSHSQGGLVGSVQPSATLTLSASINSGAVGGAAFEVGGLIGKSEGTTIIVSSHSDGEISSTAAAGSMGGLVGFVGAGELEISFSTAASNVTASSASGLGGLVGRATGELDISDSYSSGDVIGAIDVGGIVGIVVHADSEIERVTSSGAITASGDNAGGLVGHLSDGEIRESAASGNVDGANRVGGLVGLMKDGEISKSFAAGDASGSASLVGGFVGRMNAGSISNSFSTGNASAATKAGGFAGEIAGGSVDRSYSIGDANAPSDSAGGFVAENAGTIEYSFSVGSTNSGGAEGLFVANINGGGSVDGTNFFSDTASCSGCGGSGGGTSVGVDVTTFGDSDNPPFKMGSQKWDLSIWDFSDTFPVLK